MATAARWDMASWRNEARTFTIMVRGRDLTGVPVRQQVRDAPDTPGDPIIALETVTDAGAQGFRLESVTIENGVPVSRIVGRYDAATMRDKLPYAAEVGQDFRMSHAIQIGGVTQLYGDWWARATTMDSDTAGTSGEPAYDRGSSAPPVASSATLTIAADEVMELVIDGADIVGAHVVHAEEAAATALAAAASVQSANQSIYAIQNIGLDGTPADGLQAEIKTYVFAEPVEKAGTVTKIRYFGKASAPLVIRRFTRTGTTLTQVGVDTTITLAPGAQTAEVSIPVNAGDLLGFVLTGAWISYIVQAGDGTRYYEGTGTSFEDAGTNNDVRLQLAFEVQVPYLDQPTYQKAVDDAARARAVTDDLVEIGYVGRPVDPVTGLGANPGVFMFAQPVEHDCEITEATIFGAGFAAPGVLKLRIFDVSDGVASQSGPDTLLTLQNGKLTRYPGLSVTVRAGQYVGFYAPSQGFTFRIAPVDNGGWYLAAGDVSTFSLGTVNTEAQLQVQFKTRRIPAAGIPVIENRVSGLEQCARLLTGNSLPILLVIDGNSQAAGFGVTPFSAFMRDFLGCRTVNVAVSGQTTQNMSADAATQVDSLTATPGMLPVLIAMEMFNDMNVNGVSAAQAVANMRAYCAARRTAGFKVGVTTVPNMIPTGGFGPTSYNEVNTLLRAQWKAFADFLVDWDADPRLNARTDARYYQADQRHWTVLSEQLAAVVARHAMRDWLLSL